MLTQSLGNVRVCCVYSHVMVSAVVKLVSHGPGDNFQLERLETTVTSTLITVHVSSQL